MSVTLADEAIMTEEEDFGNPAGADLSDPGGVKDIIAGAMPVMSSAQDPTVELPRGIPFEGEWQTRAEVRELTGEDEEKLSRYKTEEDLFLGLLVAGTVRVGKIDLTELSVTAREEALGNLLVNEQMVLFLAIVRVTFGNERDLNWQCTGCNADNETILIISEDFPVVPPDDMLGEHVYVDGKGNKIEYRGITGNDVAGLNAQASPAQKTTEVLSKIITKINGEYPLEPALFMKQMGLKDRRGFSAAVQDIQPVVELGVELPCATCGKEQTLSLTWTDLFLA